MDGVLGNTFLPLLVRDESSGSGVVAVVPDELEISESKGLAFRLSVLLTHVFKNVEEVNEEEAEGLSDRFPGSGVYAFIDWDRDIIGVGVLGAVSVAFLVGEEGVVLVLLDDGRMENSWV